MTRAIHGLQGKTLLLNIKLKHVLLKEKERGGGRREREVGREGERERERGGGRKEREREKVKHK